MPASDASRGCAVRSTSKEYAVGRKSCSSSDEGTERPPIDVPVSRLRSFPAEVSGHGFALHAAPGLRIVVVIQRAHGGVHELLRRVAVEQESGHAILDRVRETAHAPG